MKTYFYQNPDKTVIIEGVTFEFSDEYPSSPGDIYIAERNSGIKLLTVRYIDHENQIVFPMEMAYAYDLYECRKVVRML
jgi:hypothetical protein